MKIPNAQGRIRVQLYLLVILKLLPQPTSLDTNTPLSSLGDYSPQTAVNHIYVHLLVSPRSPVTYSVCTQQLEGSKCWWLIHTCYLQYLPMIPLYVLHHIKQIKKHYLWDKRLQKMASIFHIWHFHREIGMENQTNLPVIAHHGVIGLSWARASFPAWTHTSIFIHTQGGTCANTITPNSSIFLSHTHKTNLLRSSTHSCCWHPHFNFMSLFILCLLFFPSHSPSVVHFCKTKQRSWRLSTLQKVLFIHVTRHYSVSQQSNPSISIKPCSLNPSAYPSLNTKKHMSFFTMNPAAKM